MRSPGDRAQLVLAAAAVAALALAPVVFAYLQLGYHADVRASTEYDEPLAGAERSLARSVHEAGASVTPRYSWDRRVDAARAVRRQLAPRLEAVRRSRVDEGVAYGVGYNRSAARAWAAEACPGGPNREFGDCVAVGGVVLQERLGETHVLAVALDVTAHTDRGRAAATFVLPVVAGAPADPSGE